MRFLLVTLAAAVLAAPTLAAAADAPGAALWLAKNTDVAAAQVVIAGSDVAYSLEPLGGRGPTGEVVALVRTEALSASWGAARGFRSWDAHVLFDCEGGRMRVIRSASYAESNRRGAAREDDAGGHWFLPQSGEPAAKLLAAACDAKYAWPLRADPAAATVGAEPLESSPRVASAAPRPVRLAVATVAAPARGAFHGVRWAYRQVAGGFAATTHAVQMAAQRRAQPAAAPPSEAALAAPVLALAEPADGVEVNPVAATPAVAAAPVVAAVADAAAPRPALSSPRAAPARARALSPYAVQVAYGPFAAGARRALGAAAGALGPTAERLTLVTDVADLGGKRRYAARLSGFPTAASAAQACMQLAQAGQGCLVTRARLASVRGAPALRARPAARSPTPMETAALPFAASKAAVARRGAAAIFGARTAVSL